MLWPDVEFIDSRAMAAMASTCSDNSDRARITLPGLRERTRTQAYDGLLHAVRTRYNASARVREFNRSAMPSAEA